MSKILEVMKQIMANSFYGRTPPPLEIPKAMAEWMKEKNVTFPTNHIVVDRPLNQGEKIIAKQAGVLGEVLKYETHIHQDIVDEVKFDNHARAVEARLNAGARHVKSGPRFRGR